MAAPTPTGGIQTLTVSGTPRAMGRAQGEHFREQTREVCELRIEATTRWAEAAGRQAGRAAVIALAEACLDYHRAYSSAVWDEFVGIAEGARVSLAELLVGNGYTDVRDIAAGGPTDAAGCTTFSATPEASEDGQAYVGQTWDMDQHMLPHVYLCRRQPAAGPATIGITTAGCLSLIGLNDRGIAVGNSNLVPTDARPGVIYLALIHQALAATSLAGAVAAIVEARRASGHQYYLSDGQTVRHIETTACRSLTLRRDGGCHVQTNHYRHPAHQDRAAPPVPHGRTRERRQRLSELLAASPEAGPRRFQRALEDDEVTVRQPRENVLTCAAVLLRPGTRELWATVGPPTPEGWSRYTL